MWWVFCEESQPKSSGLGGSVESSLLAYSLECLLGTEDTQVHIPCFSGAQHRKHMPKRGATASGVAAVSRKQGKG